MKIIHININIYIININIYIMEIYKPIQDTLFWKNKYIPNKINDLDIDKYIINDIIKWIKNYDINKSNKKKKTIKKNINIENDIDNDDIDSNIQNINEEDDIYIKEKIKNNPQKSSLIISGNHGIGKTSIITTILNSLNYVIYQINFNKITYFKNINEFLDKPIFNNSITDKINNKKTNKKVILIDNLESILSINQRKFIMKLIKYNDIYWDIPIIFISNLKHNKLVYFAKKFSYEIKIPNPHKDILENILCKISINENINIGDEKVIDEIIKYSEYDIRSLITNLQSLKNIYEEKYINMEDINTFIITCKMKDNDPDIFNATNKLFYGYDNIDNIIRLFEIEKTVMPLMIQQHYVDYLKNNNIDSINKISESLSMGDILENFIYENNIYDIRDIQSFYQCIFPSYILSNKLNPKKIESNKFGGTFTYPKDLNKTSIRCINYTKNICPSNKIFRNMDIDDYMYFNKIIKNIIKSGEYKHCNDILSNYNCNISLLESVLKIDKIDENKFGLSTKIKKKIINECSNITDEYKINKINKKK